MRRWCLAENANANFSLVIPPEKIGVALHQDQMPDIQRDLKGRFSLCWEPECEVWVAWNWLFLLWYEVISAMQDYQFQPSNFCPWSPLTLVCWKNLGIPYFEEQNSQAVKLSLLPVLRQQLHVVSTCVSRAGKLPGSNAGVRLRALGATLLLLHSVCLSPPRWAGFICFTGGFCAALLGKALRNRSCAPLLIVNLDGKRKSCFFSSVLWACRWWNLHES